MRKFLYFGKDDRLLYKYGDKNGIKIYIIDKYENKLIKDDVGNFILIHIKTKREFITSLIDYCITECVYSVDDLFVFLNKIKKSKVAKRWLWKTIKNIEFGNTGYKVKDLYNRSSRRINDEDVDKKYNKYRNDKNSKTIY